jgi:uncharacterized protein (TIGR02186 family)
MQRGGGCLSSKDDGPCTSMRGDILKPGGIPQRNAVADNIPVGDYEVDLKLFQNGEMVGETVASFTVVKVGIGDLVVNAAANHSLIYGMTVTSVALFTGWLAWIAFRRD